MDAFRLYHYLSSLRGVLQEYPEQKKTVAEITALLEQISTKKYRVAVIGEFNRGKSSLVNSLLGIDVLPTDILPTTAVINRIVFDTQQKIVIRFKDGTVREDTLAQLREFATKTDKDKEAAALQIRQIDVHYPSVFSSNGIELIDTPGLNEEEKMTETTLSVLKHIDTAIIVISALMPLSLSEQSLICSLIEQQDIYHLTFVVSFIDKISDDAEEQDEMIGFIADRIKNETYAQFCASHDDPLLLQKAERILKEPKVFGVSAKQAMQGFIKNDNALLQASRFPHFKLELTALLTASQQEDMAARAERIAGSVGENFPAFHERRMRQLDAQIAGFQERLGGISAFARSGRAELVAEMSVMQRLLQKNDMTGDRGFLNTFFRGLIGIVYSVDASSAEKKSAAIRQKLVEREQRLYGIMAEQTKRIENGYMQRMREAGLSPEALEAEIAQLRLRMPLPSPEDAKRAADASLRAPTSNEAVNVLQCCAAAFQSAVDGYCAEWRVLLLRQSEADTATVKAQVEEAEAGISRLTALRNALLQHDAANRQAVAEAVEALAGGENRGGNRIAP